MELTLNKIIQRIMVVMKLSSNSIIYNRSKVLKCLMTHTELILIMIVSAI